MSSADDLPTRIEELHHAILQSDETAPSRLAELALPFLVNSLEREFVAVRDRHLIETAAHDALISYFSRPDQYRPNKSRLHSYLRMSARGDLLNLLKQQKIEAARTEPDVEDRASRPEHMLMVDIDEERSLWQAADARESEIATTVAKAITDPVDRQIIDLMLDGTRATEPFSSILGIEHLSIDQQRLQVKQHKDRLKKAVQRAVRGVK
jgi:hypothetical protein